MRETDWDTSGSSSAKENMCMSARCQRQYGESGIEWEGGRDRERERGAGREGGLGVEAYWSQRLEMTRDRSRKQEMAPEKSVHRRTLFLFL